MYWSKATRRGSAPRSGLMATMLEAAPGIEPKKPVAGSTPAHRWRRSPLSMLNAPVSATRSRRNGSCPPSPEKASGESLSPTATPMTTCAPARA